LKQIIKLINKKYGVRHDNNNNNNNNKK